MVLAVSEWQWVVNQGVSFAVLAFIGLLLWRVLVGSKGNGYQGLLIKWANNMSSRMQTHAEEQTAFGRAVKAEHKVIDDALTLLVESEKPPIGAAFMAASAVHKTAADVAALRHAAIQCMKICRIIAKQFPDVEHDIDMHCEEIERIIGGQ